MLARIWVWRLGEPGGWYLSLEAGIKPRGWGKSFVAEIGALWQGLNWSHEAGIEALRLKLEPQVRNWSLKAGIVA